MEKLMYTAADVAELLCISQSKAYQIIRQLNEELRDKGYLTLAGKIPPAYLMERVYYGKSGTN